MALEVKGLQKSDLKLGSTTTHGVEVADRASLTPSSRRPLEQRTPAYPPFMLLIEVCCMEVVREDAMKIGQGQLDTSQLIERMQKAHAESKEVKGSGASFALDAAGAPATESAPASGIERSVLEIAERVLNGELSDPSATRREVLEAIDDALAPHLYPPRADGGDPRECPLCGRGRLNLKTARSGGAFIGCTNYPECRYTRPLSAPDGEQPVGDRVLGHDDGDEISLKTGRFGPYVQRGEATEEVPKPPRASIPKGWDAATMDLEKALRLL